MRSATIPLVLCAIVAVFGCERDACGDGAGEVVGADGARFCVVETRAVIEGGITCPPELPSEVLLEEGLVCTSEPTDAEDLPPEVCAALGGCTPREPIPDADAGGVPDGGTADAEAADPGHGRWTPIAASGPARHSASCATDSSGHLFVLGGWAGPTASIASRTSDARRFDPTTGDWTELPLAGRPSPRTGAALVAFDAGALEGLFVFGGDDGAAALGDGYVLVDGAWTAISSAGAPSPRDESLAVWTGSEILVWGGIDRTPLGDGAAYDPATDTWRALPTENAPSARGHCAGAWTGDELVVWGGDSTGHALSDGAAYDPIADRWRALATPGAPTARLGAFAAWTGSAVVVWGGVASDGRPLVDGALYDPARDGWRALSELASDRTPVLGAGASAAGWDGARFIVWGASDATDTRSTGAALDPIGGAWSALNLTGAPSPRHGACAAAGPAGVYVFGGASANALLADGAVLAP